jgi:uncharacterized RDD family membrane protein YckC
MSDFADQNRFAPPRANVEDPIVPATEMVVATRGARFLAVLVDVSPGLVLGIMAALLIPGFLTGQLDLPGPASATLGVLGLVFGVLAIGWTVWTIVLLYRYGQTIGKKVLGIRVVRMDGSRVSFARFFFLRWLGVAVIAAIVAGIGGAMHIRHVGNIVSLVDCLLIFGAARRCLHDYIADTQVVTAASSPHATLEGARAS